MAENFPKLVKEKVIQVQDSQNPTQDEPKRPTAIYIIIKMAKVKNKEGI